VNGLPNFGLAFGWGPTGSSLIAFSNRDGRIVIMDDQGRKQEISSSKATLFPAWTQDGKRLAYLQRTSKDKVALNVVDVTQPVP
jgi:Tol biopolymer transport system component